MVTMKRLTALSLLLILFAASHASAQAQSVATSQSPHGGLSVPCANCHTAQGWKPIRAVPEFDHNQTQYPLRGMHVGVACTACHVKLVFNNVGNKCQDCHADIHKRQLGANCAQCHTVRGWGVSVQQIQDHNNRFPLTGAHAAVDCDACHKNAANSKFQTMSTNCLSCHMREFKGTTNPNHVAGGVAFQAPCEQCHSTDNWQNAKFDHSVTGFLLTLGHASPPVTCDQCHKGNYNLAATPCVTCHMQDFTNAKNPDHVAGGFAQTCETCHTTNPGWSPATFDHSRTNFPLTGSHMDPPRVCADCHINNNYTLTSANTACVSCHLKDYNAAATPINHIQVGFPTTCQLCHDTVLWTNAKFDHNTTTFPLTGFHLKVACASCHVNNNYTTLPTDCYGCHKTNYDATTNPVHKAAPTVFTTACATCHNTTAWTGATFNHTWFPLNHGGNAANGVCAVCHTNPNDYAVFQCTNCHGKTQTDGKHGGVRGYVYNSVNCYQCHKN